jgi:SSS family solute:Na+ symporter
MPLFISSYLPEWFGAIFLVVMLAAAMSTLSALFHSMGTAAGRDVYEKYLGKTGNALDINRAAVLVSILVSTIIAWLSSSLPAADAIIAKFTIMFYELTTAAFLTIYVGALYFKKMPKAAAIWGMVAGFAAWFFWTFFVHYNAAYMLICKLLFGKTSIVADTPFQYLSMIGTTFVALPVSIIVTVIVWGIVKASNRKDISDSHINKCFEGI